MTDTKKTAVIKVGGDVLLDKAEREGLAANIKDLTAEGWSVVLLHGGGPQVNALQEKHGLTPNKVAGRRITSEADLVVVKQAIAGEVNVNLTATLIQAGLPAFGCHGASGHLIRASKRPPVIVTGAGDKPIDFGEVGDVTGINAELLQGLLDLGQIPVIATLGVSEGGRIFNINADTTVVQIARALKADLLLLTTGVGAVFRDLKQPESRIAQVSRQQANKLIAEGIIQGGMIPKVEEAMKLLSEGVNSIAIVSGRNPGAFLSVANGTGESGTRIVD
ncbi:acetylglutamate kinase [Aliikangiella marina]|uniref:Acetylglutamate kinase n=1 Tax=Aliikangiella marina TaxID=1712262 RepID=A0A545T4W2_9GAMM|nr:acetylglutamate kinase [Aliikangiella marina]TQV72270.1 acetylglutamate kinase [Aliikangiella marina]